MRSTLWVISKCVYHTYIRICIYVKTVYSRDMLCTPKNNYSQSVKKISKRAINLY